MAGAPEEKSPERERKEGFMHLSSACSRSCNSRFWASSCERLLLGFWKPSELARRLFRSLF